MSKLKVPISPQEKAKELEECNEFMAAFGEDFSIKDVLSSNRMHYLSRSRSMICLYFRNKGYSLMHIGSLINRDHATALHLLNNCKLNKGKGFKEIQRAIKKVTKAHTKEVAAQFIKQKIDKLQKLLRETE